MPQLWKPLNSHNLTQFMFLQLQKYQAYKNKPFQKVNLT